MSGLRLPSVSSGATAIMAKANTREPGVVKTTIGLASNWIVIVAMATEMLLLFHSIQRELSILDLRVG